MSEHGTKPIKSVSQERALCSETDPHTPQALTHLTRRQMDMMKLLLFFTVFMVKKIHSMNSVSTAMNTTTTNTPTTRMITAETLWFNLDGKMVTVSQPYCVISFFAPPEPELPHTAATATVPFNAPPSITAGLSVCVRYVVGTDLQYPASNFFTISAPRGGFLRLKSSYRSRYQLTISRTPSYSSHSSYSTYLTTNVVLWPSVEPSLWTRICLTVDSRKNVVQMFRGRQMSVRKILPTTDLPQGKPVITFSGFDGQVTDVQMWDYPLSYKEVFAYMNFPVLRPAGNVLTWSHISYSVGGRVLVEDVYERQAKQPSRGKLHAAPSKTTLVPTAAPSPTSMRVPTTIPTTSPALARSATTSLVLIPAAEPLNPPSEPLILAANPSSLKLSSAFRQQRLLLRVGV